MSRQHAPAANRNREPILHVLKDVLPDEGEVLEIASGTGQHAAFIAPRFPALRWQPTDVDFAACRSIAAWTAHGGASNILPPLQLDVTDNSWPIGVADVVVCINMIHISPWRACVGLVEGSGRVLPPGGILYLYGPFQIDGHHTAPSNASFDRNLRQQNPEWGVRDVADVAALANGVGMTLYEQIEMPANNRSLLFRRE